MAGQTSVNPLIAPSIAWAAYLKDTVSLTGRSPARGLDSSNLKLSDFACFLASIGEFQSGKAQNPLDILRGETNPLKHLFFGFLISGSTSLIFRIMELTSLEVTTTRGLNKIRVAIVTGTLSQWKDAIVSCLDQKMVHNFELRWTFNQCLDFLHAAGLRAVFDNYRRKGLDDKTFLLEYKS